MAAPQPNCPACSAVLTGGARFCGGCGRSLTASGTTGAAVEDVDLSGREIAGRYRLLERLGQGGMGAVYRAEQLSLKREVAVKMLKPELSDDPALVKRFNTEAELAARLNHPNTVTLFDFGQDRDGSLFIAMELVQGRSLRDVLTREGALTAARSLAICAQVSASLADAHGAGIVHRDLKPDNVMLTERGKASDVVRVLDFGIAKLRDERGDVTANPVTRAGDLLGTPQYMAPEQIRGELVDGRTDVYAMGVMLYEMVTGRLPFSGNTVMAILGKHLTEQPAPPSSLRPELGVPPAIDQLVLAAMQKLPASRPASMEAFGDEVERLRAHLAPTAGRQVARRTTRPPGVPLSIDEPMGYVATQAPPLASTPLPAAAQAQALSAPPPYSPPPGTPMTPASAAGPLAAAGHPQAGHYAVPAATHGQLQQPYPSPHSPPPHLPPTAGGSRLGLWLSLSVAAVAVVALVAVLVARKASSSSVSSVSSTDETGETTPTDDTREVDDTVEAEDSREVDDTGPHWPTDQELGDEDHSAGKHADGELWKNSSMHYQLLVPPGYVEQAVANADLSMWHGVHKGQNSVLLLSGENYPGVVTLEVLTQAGLNMINTGGGELVSTEARNYQGRQGWVVLYDDPQNQARWEAVFFAHRGAVIGIALGMPRAAFATSKSLREELYSQRLRLP